MTTTLDLDDLVQQGDNPVAVEELKQMRQELELMKGKKEILLSAAKELKSYIDDANQKLKKGFTLNQWSHLTTMTTKLFMSWSS